MENSLTDLGKRLLISGEHIVKKTLEVCIFHKERVFEIGSKHKHYESVFLFVDNKKENILS